MSFRERLEAVAEAYERELAAADANGVDAPEWRAAHVEMAEGLRAALAVLDEPEALRRCRACGCTDADCSGCVARTGAPCAWVQEDLCSACAMPMRTRAQVVSGLEDVIQRAPGCSREDLVAILVSRDFAELISASAFAALDTVEALALPRACVVEDAAGRFACAKYALKVLGDLLDKGPRDVVDLDAELVLAGREARALAASMRNRVNGSGGAL